MRTNDELVEYLVRTGALRTKRLIETFRAVDRKHFVPEMYAEETYADYPLPIGEGQTISQPTTVAMMLEWLQPKEGDRILDVGSGSGWTTALLAKFVGENGSVFGVELEPSLVLLGKMNLAKIHAHVRIQLATEVGLPDQAPFDRILVSAAAEKLPEQLIHQLKENGKLVIPIKDSIWEIEKNGKKTEHHGFSFVPLR